jgi:hypothetical protein
MRDLQSLLARIVDVALIFTGAAVASQIRFDNWELSGFFAAFVIFSAAFALLMFPVFGVYE